MTLKKGSVLVIDEKFPEGEYFEVVDDPLYVTTWEKNMGIVTVRLRKVE